MLEKTLSEARKDLSRIVADCAKNEVAVITVRGKSAAYLISSAHYESMKEGAFQNEMEPIFNEFDSLFKALSNK